MDADATVSLPCPALPCIGPLAHQGDVSPETRMFNCLVLIKRLLCAEQLQLK
jgi:hypothetical protein